MMSSRAMRRRRFRFTSVMLGCLSASFGLYAASPLVALWSVASAMRHDDVGSVREALAWRDVRVGLKADLGPGATVRLASAHVAPVQDELPDFGSSFATTIVSHVVDDVVTPEHLVAMLTHASASSARSDASDGTGLLAMLGRVRHVGFDGPAGFQAAIRLSGDPEAAPVTVSMRIVKWQWKITRIHVPDEMLGQGGSNRT